MRHTLYDVLEVSPKASQETITAAYRSLSKRFHPDVNKAPGAVELMGKINKAYEVLRNVEARRAYDRVYL